MEKYIPAKRCGKTWHMFKCPGAELWSPLPQQQVESFSPPLVPSNTHIEAVALLCVRTGKSPNKIKNKLLRTLRRQQHDTR